MLADALTQRDRARCDATIEQSSSTDRDASSICCGSGGVGKTTTAAVLALEGARRGRNACVVTIDPAKRLADALGLEQLSDTPSEIDRDRWDDDGPTPCPAAGCRR